MNNTYFILSRNIFESAIWRDDPHILKLFIYLIGNARHSRKDKVYPKIKIKRGELVTSLMQISEDNEYVLNGIIKKWSRQKVSRMLKLLEDQNYIKRVSDTYGTHINICNYDIYQSPDTYKTDTDGTVVERLWNGCGQGVGTNNNVNNDKNGKNGNNGKDKIKLHSCEKRRSSVLSDLNYDVCKGFMEYIKEYHHNKVNSLLRGKESWQVYEQWINDIRLLNNRGYDRKTILDAMKRAMDDDFWRNNFYTISKLNTKNKHGIYFIDVFLDIKKSKNERINDMLDSWLEKRSDNNG